MKRVVVIGAGGQGREVAEILRHQAQQGEALAVLGFVDDSEKLHGQIIDDLPVLGDWTWFENADLTDVSVVCAVGQPLVCQRLVRRALTLGLPFVNVISPQAHISSYARVGQGVTVFPQVVVNTGASIGDYCILNVGATVSHDTIIGPYSNINPGAHLAGNVTVGEGCYIGMGANVIQGRYIGAWTTVGANAAVTRDLSDNVTAVGVPARVIKTKKENE